MRLNFSGVQHRTAKKFYKRANIHSKIFHDFIIYNESALKFFTNTAQVNSKIFINALKTHEQNISRFCNEAAKYFSRIQH